MICSARSRGKLVRPLLYRLMAVKGETQRVLKRVTADLEDYVLLQGATPGSRLPSERVLAEKLDVSRSTIREGLQRLVARGLVETRRGSGVFIASTGARSDLAAWGHEPAPSDRAEMFEVRLMIECSAARLAAQRASADDLHMLGKSLARLEHAIEAHEINEEARADTEFHAALIVAAHNSLLTKLCIGLNQAIRTHISSNTFEATYSRADASSLASMRLEQHQQIYEWVVAQEADKAYIAASAHLQFVQGQFFGRS